MTAGGSPDAPCDVAIVGAGAAGLATAIVLGRRVPGRRVVLLDGARKPGAKILVSGGARCNVTNTVVTEADFNGGRAAVIRRILRTFPAAATVEFFRGMGVALREEPGGKLFPASNRSRDVLAALLDAAARAGVEMRFGHRVREILPGAGAFRIATSEGTRAARAVVLATGGLSLPKTGSDGWGYEAARRLGHSIVPTTPALVPLVLASGPEAVHAALSGVALPVRLDVRVDGAVRMRLRGPLLWTHVGASGPAVLDASRHWLRARFEERPVGLTASFCPDESFESLEARWIERARTHPTQQMGTALSRDLPAACADAILGVLRIPTDGRLADLPREARRRLVHALTAWPLDVTGSRGYNFAEVTAGGVPLSEIDPSTMASRVCPGLFLVGEILDVDGRLGGFNFQWAWSTAHVAAEGLAGLIGRHRREPAR